MPPGAQSHNHHERADEIRAELAKLESLYKDGVLDHATYMHGCEKCWKGCYSVRLMRGVAYTGEISVDMSNGGAASQVRLSEKVLLEFYRPSAKKQVLVELPRPENVRPTGSQDKDGSYPSAKVAGDRDDRDDCDKANARAGAPTKRALRLCK